MAAILLGILVLAPATAACLYYLVLTTLGWQARRTSSNPGPPRHTFAVLIPAHNEELSLTAAVRSVQSSDYPPEKVRVLVVADNCTDGTADVARSLGAECLERTDPVNRGKGYALALGIPHALASCVTLPDVVRYAAPHAVESMPLLARALGLATDGQTATELIEAAVARLDRFIRSLGLPRRLGEVGSAVSNVDRLAAAVLNDFVVGGTPGGPPDHESLVALLAQFD